MNSETLQEYKKIASEIRGAIIKTSCEAKVPHLGSCLSCVDLLVALYWDFLKIDPQKPEDKNRDRFILSKGHAAPALFQVLSKRGYYPASEMGNYNKKGSRFGEHPPAHGIPGVEAATGSLGHGLPIGLGMALAAKISGENYRTVALMSDGECNEGSVWEAAMMAPAQKLDNLVAIVDFNKWQATGRSREVLQLDSLKGKFDAFGWDTVEIDGNDMEAVCTVLNSLEFGKGKPLAVIAHTVKGKGVSFMEDDNNWHYRTPKPEEVEAAFKELGLKVGAQYA